MFRPPVVIILGVSASGKSTLLSACATRYPNVVPVSASSLLMKASPDITSRDQLRDRTPDQIHAAQKRLPAEIDLLLEGLSPGGILALDAHATVKTPTGCTVILKWSAFAACHASRIILLTAPPEEIARRRAAEANLRTREQETPAEIAAHQELTRRMARIYQRLGNIPLFELEMPTVDAFYHALTA